MSFSLRSKKLNHLSHLSREEPDSLSEIDDMEETENKNSILSSRKSRRESAKIQEHKTPVSKKREVKRKSEIISIDDSSDEENNSNENVEISPPKQQKVLKSPESLFSPTRLLDRLSIEDLDNEKKDQVKVPSQRKSNKYQNARCVLHSAETNILPGREKEIDDLKSFLLDHLNNSKSGSLYISGPPGTGKTACLSKILKSDKATSKFTKVYINCTSISTIGSIYKKICTELKLKAQAKTEKSHLHTIEKYLSENRRMVLLVLDEIDQLVGQKQSVLYTIFEWPAKCNSSLILIGIANSLDLTDRLLIRLNAKCDLKPKLMHFLPYTKQQIIDIFKSRLEEAGVADIMAPASLQLLAAKVSAVSGDVRRALDIGRRVIEIAEQQKVCGQKINLSDINLGDDDVVSIEKHEEETIQPVQAMQVVKLLNKVYGASQTLNDDIEDAFPLQQKILLCTLMLMLKKEKNKDITVGRLHDVYKRVCIKRNLLAVDQAEFGNLCSLVETRGIVKVIKKKEPRLSKIALQWDEGEVNAALKDKQLIAAILDDAACLSR